MSVVQEVADEEGEEAITYFQGTDMTPNEIRPGARFRICGTVKESTELGNYMVTFDGMTGKDILPPSALIDAELISPAPLLLLTKELSALIRERLEAGDLADVLNPLTE